MSRSRAVLISVAELADLLDSAPQLVLADVRWTLGGPPGRPEFEADHIPGAVWVDLESQLAGPPGIGGRHPLPPVATFQRAMARRCTALTVRTVGDVFVAAPVMTKFGSCIRRTPSRS